MFGTEKINGLFIQLMLCGGTLTGLNRRFITTCFQKNWYNCKIGMTTQTWFAKHKTFIYKWKKHSRRPKEEWLRPREQQVTWTVLQSHLGFLCVQTNSFLSPSPSPQWKSLHIPSRMYALNQELTGSPSTTSPLGFRITMTNWAWKVIISTGPWSIIFPIANWETEKTVKPDWLQGFFLSVKNKETYIDIVNVQDLRVELKPHGLGLLNWVCQLAVRLQKKHIITVQRPSLAVLSCCFKHLKVKVLQNHSKADTPLHSTSPSTHPALPGS